MRKLFFLLTLIFSLCFAAAAQNQPNALCPNVEITTPSGGNTGRGERLAVAVKVNVTDWQSLQYKWKISPDISVEKQGKPVVYFQAIGEDSGLDLTATVEIKGLPENCRNIFSTSFRINFNVGTPLELEEYGAMPFTKEKAKLDSIAAHLKTPNASIQNPIVYFINYLPKSDDKTIQLLSIRELKIADYLRQNHQISRENIVFVRGEDKKYRTRILIVPAKF